MKLLDVKRDNLYLYIHTTDGPRKQSLKWHGVDQLEAKCRAAIGKEIVHSTSGKWDPNVWFQDISVIDDPSSSVPPKELDIPTHIDLTKRRAEIHRIDQGKIRNKITKIFGPPGTGKTTKLISLVEEHIANGTDPKDIGFFSFTNFSTKVAKNRIVQKFPDLDLNVDFTGFRTLHSLAYQTFPTKIELLSPEQAKHFDSSFYVEEVMMEENDPTSIVYRAKQIVVDAAAVARSRLQTFSEYLKTCPEAEAYRLNRWLGYPAKSSDRMVFDNDVPRLTRYVDQYESHKDKLGVIDYTSILELACGNNSSIPTYKVIFVDESQDLSLLQWAFAEKLFEKAEKIYLAGDDDQAICESFGASSESFVSYEADDVVVLDKSYRVPAKVHEMLFREHGIISALNNLFNRKEKEWFSRDSDQKGAAIMIYKSDLQELISKYPSKDWLIMAATHNSLSSVSERLLGDKIPHYLSNELVSGEPTLNLPTIRLATVWGAKGGEADVSVILRGEYVDEIMFDNDPRLLYVARTRTKQVHLEVSNLPKSRFEFAEPYISALPNVVRVVDDSSEEQAIEESDCDIFTSSRPTKAES